MQQAESRPNVMRQIDEYMRAVRGYLVTDSSGHELEHTAAHDGAGYVVVGVAFRSRWGDSSVSLLRIPAAADLSAAIATVAEDEPADFLEPIREFMFGG
jgi:hypothetical protein